MNNAMRKIIYYENILEFKESTLSQLQYHEVNNWNLCRTCLQDTHDGESTDFSGTGICLVGVDGQMLNVKDVLVSATGLQILDNDHLPTKICKACLTKVSALHFFKLQTERAEFVLERMLAKLDETIHSVETQKPVLDITINEADCSGNNDNGETDVFAIETYSDQDCQDEVDILESDHDVKIKNCPDDELLESDPDDKLTNCKDCKETLKSVDVLTEESRDVLDSQESFYAESNPPLEEHENEPVEEYFYEELEGDEETDEYADVANKGNSNKRKSVEKQIEEDSNIGEKRRKRNKGGKPLLKDLSCLICHMPFAQQQSLVNHVQAVHPSTKAFKCRKCGQMFCHIQSLSRHMHTHFRKHIQKVCSHCGKTFIRVDDWRRHLRIHTGERPYVCKICEKGFKQGSELREHALTHDKNRRFECSICGHILQSRNGLYLHKKVHVGAKNHICMYCEKRFITKGELRSHLRVHNKIKHNREEI